MNLEKKLINIDLRISYMMAINKKNNNCFCEQESIIKIMLSCVSGGGPPPHIRDSKDRTASSLL